jgi:hypothetical protein
MNAMNAKDAKEKRKDAKAEIDNRCDLAFSFASFLFPAFLNCEKDRHRQR